MIPDGALRALNTIEFRNGIDAAVGAFAKKVREDPHGDGGYFDSSIGNLVEAILWAAESAYNGRASVPVQPSQECSICVQRCEDGECNLELATSVYHDGCDGRFCAHGVCQECGAHNNDDAADWLKYSEFAVPVQPTRDEPSDDEFARALYPEAYDEAKSLGVLGTYLAEARRIRTVLARFYPAAPRGVVPDEPIPMQACPVCNGRGFVSAAHYATSGYATTGGTTDVPCRTCKGATIIPMAAPVEDAPQPLTCEHGRSLCDECGFVVQSVDEYARSVGVRPTYEAEVAALRAKLGRVEDVMRHPVNAWSINGVLWIRQSAIRAALDGEPQPSAGEGGAGMIAAERRRQVEVEGYDATHDAEHSNGAILDAAIGCIEAVRHPHPTRTPRAWPNDWHWKGWKRYGDPIPLLVKAGALIAAEIDRIRAAASPEAASETKP
jgi:hypothetical protein